MVITHDPINTSESEHSWGDASNIFQPRIFLAVLGSLSFPFWWNQTMLKCTVILWDVPLDSASVGNIMTPESADTDTFNLEYLIFFFFSFSSQKPVTSFGRDIQAKMVFPNVPHHSFYPLAPQNLLFQRSRVALHVKISWWWSSCKYFLLSSRKLGKMKPPILTVGEKPPSRSWVPDSPCRGLGLIRFLRPRDFLGGPRMGSKSEVNKNPRITQIT